MRPYGANISELPHHRRDAHYDVVIRVEGVQVHYTHTHLRQYLYICTSKASKLKLTCEHNVLAAASSRSGRVHTECEKLYFCTSTASNFVREKQVN